MCSCALEHSCGKMCPLQLMFFALFLSCTLVFSTATTGCPSLLVSQENRFLSHLSNHLIETNDFLVLMVGMSENALAYSSLSPQLQSCNNGRISNITSSWSQNDDMWTVTLSAMNCGLECCVQIFLDSLVSNCVVMEWVGHFFRVTQAPLLQWLTQLNESHAVTQSTSSVPAHTLFQHIQCSPQVAVVISESELSYTISLFNNATNVSSYSICALAVLSPSVCANLSVMDMTLTHSALLLLTSAGLLVSNTTTAAGKLDWQEVPFSVQEAVFLEQNALYCKDPILNNEMVRVLSPSTDELLMYSAPPPYTNWSVQSTPCTGVCAQELVAFDHQRNTFTTVAVGNNSLAQTSSGQLLGNVSVSDVFYHLTSSSIYLLGSQVWVSIDGGSTFTSILELSSSVISYTYNEQALLLLTASGDLYHTRPGSLHYSALSATSSLTHNMSRVVLTRGNTFRTIDLSSKTSELVQIDVKEVGPCSLSYDLINPRTLYLYDNQSDCAVRDLIGYEANATSLGAGLVVSSIGVGILVALSAPAVTVSDSGTVQCLFTQEQCWSRISPGTGFSTTTHELDIWDSVELQVVVSIAEGYKLPRHFLDVVVTMGRPDLFDVMTTSNRTPTTHTLTVTVWQRNTTTYPVHSSIRLSLLHCPAVCEQCGLVSIIHTNCPSDKLLLLVCPASVESCTQRYTLPINYRPPSSLGVAIHTSPNVYNADPATLTQSAFSHVAARLNHCENKSSRLECGCTEHQSTSSDINYSDCIKSVYRHSYGKVFLLTFELLLGSGQRVNTTSIELVEFNNRTDYTLITNNSQVTGIRFKGPGLFHFNVLLINITSFCEISTPFILFVEHVPLTKAGELAITSLTTVVFGLVTMTVYLLHYFKHSRKKQ